MSLLNLATSTQLREIRRYLKRHKWIDKYIAMEICDCDRLGARIWDLRNDPLDPMDIETVMETKTNRFGHQVRYARYHLLTRREK